MGAVEVGPIACPECGRRASRVVDSRVRSTGLRRRRLCTCGHRYTTYERVVREMNQAKGWAHHTAGEVAALVADISDPKTRAAILHMAQIAAGVPTEDQHEN